MTKTGKIKAFLSHSAFVSVAVYVYDGRLVRSKDNTDESELQPKMWFNANIKILMFFVLLSCLTTWRFMIIEWEGNENSFEHYLVHCRKAKLTGKGVQEGYQLVCVCVCESVWIYHIGCLPRQIIQNPLVCTTTSGSPEKAEAKIELCADWVLWRMAGNEKVCFRQC